MRSTITLTLLMAFMVACDNNVAKAEIQCSTVVGMASQCLDFLVGVVAKPSAGCCSGLQGLAGTARSSVTDRRAICKCLGDAVEKNHITMNKIHDLAISCNLLPNNVAANNFFHDCSQ